MELFSNNASSTLVGGISSGALTLTVLSATPFPATGNFRIQIGSELMKVTGVAGAVFTVTRGIEGTTAASHSNLDTVTHIITSDALTQFRNDMLASDVEANLPAQGFSGRLYIPNDGPGFQFDDGTAWRGFGPVYPLTPPVSGAFTWVNQGGATLSQCGLGLALNTPGSNSTAFRLLVQNAPATPYTITAMILVCALPSSGGTGHYHGGLVFRNSGSGKFTFFGGSYGGGPLTEILQFSDVNTFNASNNSNASVNVHGIPSIAVGFLRIQDDGVNRLYSYSRDGVNFIQLYSEARTTYFTADQVGWAANSENNAPVAVTLLSWKQT